MGVCPRNSRKFVTIACCIYIYNRFDNNPEQLFREPYHSEFPFSSIATKNSVLALPRQRYNWFEETHGNICRKTGTNYQQPRFYVALLHNSLSFEQTVNYITDVCQARLPALSEIPHKYYRHHVITHCVHTGFQVPSSEKK